MANRSPPITRPENIISLAARGPRVRQALTHTPRTFWTYHEYRKTRIVCGNQQITGNSQFQCTGVAVTLHCSYHRLRQTLYRIKCFRLKVRGRRFFTRLIALRSLPAEKPPFTTQDTTRSVCSAMASIWARSSLNKPGLSAFSTGLLSENGNTGIIRSAYEFHYCSVSGF